MQHMGQKTITLMSPLQQLSRLDSLGQETSSSTRNDVALMPLLPTPFVNMNERRQLPPDFKPNNYTVFVFGRGKKSRTSIGNRRLKVMVQISLDRYASAPSKQEKSRIISKIVEQVRSNGGGFVRNCMKAKNQVETWSDVGDIAASKKIGSMIRKELHLKYLTSAKAGGKQRNQDHCRPPYTEERVSMIADDRVRYNQEITSFSDDNKSPRRLLRNSVVGSFRDDTIVRDFMEQAIDSIKNEEQDDGLGFSSNSFF